MAILRFFIVMCLLAHSTVCVADAVRSLDQQLSALYSACPRNTLFIVVSGQSSGGLAKRQVVASNDVAHSVR